jgi:hypothetical protein
MCYLRVNQVFLRFVSDAGLLTNGGVGSDGQIDFAPGQVCLPIWFILYKFVVLLQGFFLAVFFRFSEHSLLQGCYLFFQKGFRFIFKIRDFCEGFVWFLKLLWLPWGQLCSSICLTDFRFILRGGFYIGILLIRRTFFASGQVNKSEGFKVCFDFFIRKS